VLLEGVFERRRFLRLLRHFIDMIVHLAMENPTVVVLTDRNDLDDQRGDGPPDL
jgi:hypothetical protein